jgi:hypothetical protein
MNAAEFVGKWNPVDLSERSAAQQHFLDLCDHARLDAAVFAAYNWPANLTDDQLLEKLLALNRERAGD